MYKKILLAIFIISISVNSEKINFTSSNPFTFRDVILDLDNQDIHPIKLKKSIPGMKIKSLEVLVRVDTDN